MSDNILKVHRNKDLPDFKNPPVSEVVLSLQFEALVNLKSHHVAIFWSQVRNEFSEIAEHAAINPRFETFGAPAARPTIQIDFSDKPPLPRFWLGASTSADLLQIQQDRIVRNWRKQNVAERVYPRYEYIRDHFASDIETFQNFLRTEKVGELKVNQCEVTYTNHIDLPEDLSFAEGLSSITPLYSNQFCEKPPFEPETVDIRTKFLVHENDKPIGRVYVQFRPVFKQPTLTRAFRLDINARGRPTGSNISDAFNLFDKQRDQIVRTFASVTSEKMHQSWGRTDE